MGTDSPHNSLFVIGLPKVTNEIEEWKICDGETFKVTRLKTRYFWRSPSSPASLSSDHRARVVRLVLSKPKDLALRAVDL
jgi:hypothetical protein